MKHLHFLSIIAIALLAGCSPAKLEKTNPAITGFPTPVYDGMTDAASGLSITTLPMHTVVYTMNDKLTVNDVEFVKVHWNDTVGYVETAWLLPGGARGVVNSSPQNPITVFSDADLKVASGNTLTELQMVSFKKAAGESSQIIYFGANETTKPSFGYIAAPVLSDSLSVQFYIAYNKAFWENKNGDPKGMLALKAESPFASLPLYRELFPVQGGEENSEGTKAATGHTEMQWVNADGNPIDASAIPGKFELHYIWDDDTESSDGNHLGEALEQGVPQCAPEMSAKAYKMVFTPAPGNPISATFTCSIPPIQDKFENTFDNMRPGEPYEFVIIHQVYGVVCDDATFFIKTTTGLTGKGMIYASCGD